MGWTTSRGMLGRVADAINHAKFELRVTERQVAENRLRIDLIKVLHCGHAAVGLDFDNCSAADRNNHYIIGLIRRCLYEVSSFRLISKQKTIISDPLLVGPSLISGATDICRSLNKTSKNL